MLITKVARVLKKFNVPYAIVGGHAVALHGFVRGTLDIDLVINWTQKNLIAFEKAINEIGLISRSPIDAKNLFKNKQNFISGKNMIAWNFINPANSLEQIDLIIDYNLAGKDTVKKRVRGEDIVIISLDDLIEMKSKSNRKQDRADVEALKELK